MVPIRKKPKKKLTPLQQNRLLKISLVLAGLVMLWLLVSPQTGVYGLLKLRQEAAQLERQTELLIRSNEELLEEIERLKHDPDYLERVAREKYGMLRKNEQVFDFSGSSGDSTD